jgi:phage-related tail fiber protein
MAMNYIMRLTAIGAAKIAAATAGTGGVNLTQMAVGDGNGNPVALPTGNETALVREVYRANINALSVNANDPSMMLAELLIPSDIGNFAIHEVGVFDDDGDLFAYANFPATWKPIPADGSTRDMIVQAAMKVRNSNVVNLVVDGNLVLATRQWVLATITRAYLIPGGTTGQVLRKKSNADGDTEWANITDALNIVVDVIKESHTAVAGQTVFTLTKCSTVGVAVYIEGVRVFDYTILNETQLQLQAPLTAGQLIWFVQNEPNEPFKLRRMVAGKAYFMGQMT